MYFMIPFGTWGSAIAILYILVLAVQLIRRRTEKRILFWNTVLLAAAVGYLALRAPDLHITTDFSGYTAVLQPEALFSNRLKTLVPFGLLLSDRLGDMRAFHLPGVIKTYLVCFLLPFIWSIAAVGRFSRQGRRLQVVWTIVYFVLAEVWIFLQSISGSTIYMDPGNGILLLAGLCIGSILARSVSDKQQLRTAKEQETEE